MICFLDYRASSEERLNLLKFDLNIIDIPKSNLVYDAISGHADIQLNILNANEKKVIINKDIPNYFKEKLVHLNINFIESKSSLSSKYPDDIILNALILDKYFVHNIQYTDENLLNNIKDKKMINVKQGYTKCSILPIREKAIITSDIGIYKTLKDLDFDILLLPFGDIILPGIDYGFIGGVGGKISNDKFAFFGDLNHYIHGDKVKHFLKKYDMEPIYLKSGKLIDRGSLFIL